jgi:hypothetical protein
MIRTTATTILLALSLSVTAQVAEADRWKHVEKAGDHKQAAIIVALAGAAFTTASMAINGWDTPTKAFATVTLGVSVGFNLSSASHLKRAGRNR